LENLVFNVIQILKMNQFLFCLRKLYGNSHGMNHLRHCTLQAK
jgi:hypothetical protein